MGPSDLSSPRLRPTPLYSPLSRWARPRATQSLQCRLHWRGTADPHLPNTGILGTPIQMQTSQPNLLTEEHLEGPNQAQDSNPLWHCMETHKDQQWRPQNLLVKQLSEVCETVVHISNHPPRACYAPRGTFIWIGLVSEHLVIPDDTLKPDWVPLQDDVFRGGNKTAGQAGLKHTLVRFESPQPSGSKLNR